jgi:hypothetical protein
MIKHSQIEDVRENLEDIEHKHCTMINNRIIKNEKIKLFFLNKNYIFSCHYLHTCQKIDMVT